VGLKKTVNDTTEKKPTNLTRTKKGI